MSLVESGVPKLGVSAVRVNGMGPNFASTPWIMRSTAPVSRGTRITSKRSRSRPSRRSSLSMDSYGTPYMSNV